MRESFVANPARIDELVLTRILEKATNISAESGDWFSATPPEFASPKHELF
jgi:hypothetical protein